MPLMGRPLHEGVIQVHVPPLQFIRHVNDESALREALATRGVNGIQADVHLVQGGWQTGAGRPDDGGLPLSGFLSQLASMTPAQAKPRIRLMLDVRETTLQAEQADSLLQTIGRFAGEAHVRAVSFAPEVVNTLYHASSGRDDDVGIQLYMQDDDLRGHVQWSKREALGLPEEIGYHLRLHAFRPTTRPAYPDVAATGRRITTTGWNPLYPGWRNVDLSAVWNLRRR